MKPNLAGRLDYPGSKISPSIEFVFCNNRLSMIMPEKTQKRKLGKDPPSDQEIIDTTISIADENQC